MEAPNEIEPVSILAMQGSAFANDAHCELSADFSELLETVGECESSSDAVFIHPSAEATSDLFAAIEAGEHGPAMQTALASIVR